MRRASFSFAGMGIAERGVISMNECTQRVMLPTILALLIACSASSPIRVPDADQGVEPGTPPRGFEVPELIVFRRFGLNDRLENPHQGYGGELWATALDGSTQSFLGASDNRCQALWQITTAPGLVTVALANNYNVSIDEACAPYCWCNVGYGGNLISTFREGSWDTHIRHIEPHFSLDSSGRLITIDSTNGNVLVNDLDGREIHRFADLESPWPAVSPSGRWFVTVSEEGVVGVADLELFEVRTLALHHRCHIASHFDASQSMVHGSYGWFNAAESAVFVYCGDPNMMIRVELDGSLLHSRMIELDRPLSPESSWPTHYDRCRDRLVGFCDGDNLCGLSMDNGHSEVLVEGAPSPSWHAGDDPTQCPVIPQPVLSAEGRHLIWVGPSGVGDERSGALYVADLEAGTSTRLDMDLLPVHWMGPLVSGGPCAFCDRPQGPRVVIRDVSDGLAAVSVSSGDGQNTPFPVAYFESCSAVAETQRPRAYIVDLEDPAATEVAHCGLFPAIRAGDRLIVCIGDESDRVRLALGTRDGPPVAMTEGPVDLDPIHLPRDHDERGCALNW